MATLRQSLATLRQSLDGRTGLLELKSVWCEYEQLIIQTQNLSIQIRIPTGGLIEPFFPGEGVAQITALGL